MVLNVVIVGASGYSGVELIRILLQHPNVTIRHLFIHTQEQEKLDELYPHFRSFINIPIRSVSQLADEKIAELKETSELVFLATPSGVSKDLAPKFLNAGFKVIDLSGDFRLKDPVLYEEWYKKDAAEPRFLERSVYGLSEVFPNQIKEGCFIANPGCYATSILLALAPFYRRQIPIRSVIIDAKSGVSGAGRGLSRNTHFSEVNDNFKVYKVGKHQHIPEIEQVLTKLSGKKETVQMMTHLLPITRGILSTIYLDLEDRMTDEIVAQLYREDYQNQPFIRIRPQGEYPETKQVYGSNFCDIGYYVDQRTGRVILFSAIDNLMKGAAGQAVQNLNLMMGWDQTLGLTQIPIYP
ncbi:N-acetyl-gamma-glutamyl-phosphate reductase [Tepidibacillus fermentans]|uniref:N-acetyl-gamma-glutamyl-phosphate reductase n=1 Tax=Tepidibacillus fermentans TaxID=1281767 RepID=A0A4R3KIC6_9BACI|nr:N-acetyl-gamma-glutamyl-phosphate reductase [Tepidibacillus fermentans]TCS83288.1 N-acetyl-gamma-glutamyl-phosphate reductase [Tepidibacillus fermentans]